MFPFYYPRKLVQLLHFRCILICFLACTFASLCPSVSRSFSLCDEFNLSVIVAFPGHMFYTGSSLLKTMLKQLNETIMLLSLTCLHVRSFFLSFVGQFCPLFTASYDFGIVISACRHCDRK